MNLETCRPSPRERPAGLKQARVRPALAQVAAGLLLPLLIGAAHGQDLERGQRLFNDTAKATGQQVGVCAACHADVDTLRAMIANHGGRTDDPKALAGWLDAVITGAQPGARDAKAQYRGVLSSRDLLDLSLYISRRVISQAQPAAPLSLAAGSSLD